MIARAEPTVFAVARTHSPGNKWHFPPLFYVGKHEERAMPILLLWAVPAVIFVGGVGYFLVHAH